MLTVTKGRYQIYGSRLFEITVCGTLNRPRNVVFFLLSISCSGHARGKGHVCVCVYV